MATRGLEGRQARQDARTRGAGVQLRVSDFGLDLGGIVPAGPTPAGTAAQRAKSTPKSSSLNGGLSTRRGTSLRPSVQHEITEVDENGSVVKKRKVTQPIPSLDTPVPSLGGAGGIADALVTSGTAKSSSGKRKKRRSIGQNSARNKRRSKARTSGATSETGDAADAIGEEATEVDETGSDRDTEDMGEAITDTNETHHAHDLGDEPMAQQPEGLSRKRAAPAPVLTEAEPLWKKRKARKPNNRVGKSQTLAKPVSKAKAQTKRDSAPAWGDGIPASVPTEDEGERESEDGGGFFDQERISSADNNEAVAEPVENDRSNSAHLTSKIKRKPKKRKSVNPIQTERRKKRESLEAARQSVEQAHMISQPIRPQARRLIRQKPDSQLHDEGSLRQADIHQPQAPATKKRPKATSSAAEPNSKAAVKGSVPITIFRLKGASTLPSIAEEDEDDYASTARRSKGPNAIDALAQVTGEIVRAGLTAAEEAEKQATGRTDKTIARFQRSAIEEYGDHLQSRLMDMTQAAEDHLSAHSRLRQAKKTRKALKTDLIASRSEEDELAGTNHQLQGRHDLAAQVARDDDQIVSLYKKLGRAIRDARNSQQDEDEMNPSGLEYELRSGVNYATTRGKEAPLLEKIRAFNSRLEAAAA